MVASRRLPVVRIAADRLPEDETERDRVLQEYVAERGPHAARRPDGEWDVEIRTPPRLDYYIDPDIRAGLDWWNGFAQVTRVRDIPFAKTSVRGVQVSMSDAWTALSWSRWLARAKDNRRPVILHVDDHSDLMSPRLRQEPNGVYRDLFTGKAVDLRKPASVTAAITSGGIGMGSFLTPFVHQIHPLQIRHLRFPSGRPPRPDDPRPRRRAIPARSWTAAARLLPFVERGSWSSSTLTVSAHISAGKKPGLRAIAMSSTCLPATFKVSQRSATASVTASIDGSCRRGCVGQSLSPSNLLLK